MTDEKEDILSKIEILMKDVKDGKIADEQIVAELKDIGFLINEHFE